MQIPKYRSIKAPALLLSLCSFVLFFSLTACAVQGSSVPAPEDEDISPQAPTDEGIQAAQVAIPAEAGLAGQTMPALVPLPVSIQATGGEFVLTPEASILAPLDQDEALRAAEYLAAKLRLSTGYALKVIQTAKFSQPGTISLVLAPQDSSLGPDAYRLDASPESITIVAGQPSGLFYGVQTLRQLLPAAIEAGAPQGGPWKAPGISITDRPRYAWRGAMLDVARHFFSVDDLKGYLDQMAAYKLNRLHLHLSDDQGWRIEIKTWPQLTKHGGTTSVGGGKGGYYTQEEYKDLVAYAAARYITIIPEIDLPGHTNAALSSYPELNCNDLAPQMYTGTEVGFSSLCLNKDITYRFLDDVIGELAALTPGPYIHIGGDEAHATSPAAYIPFIEKMQALVTKHGKTMVGWEEIAQAAIDPSAVVQIWNGMTVKQAVPGQKYVVSLASRAYMDMKYDPATPLGLDWAGMIPVKDAYTWDPASIVRGMPVDSLLGVEAALWSETLVTMDDVEFMAFPRLLGYAEMAWSPEASRGWDEYVLRLAEHGPRLAFMGINYYPDSQIPWAK